MKPRRIVKNSPEPIRIRTASEKLPITGIAAYQDMLVGKPQRKSEIGVTNLKTLFTTAKKNNPKIQIKLIFMVGISANTKVFKIAKERFEKYFTGKDDYKFSEIMIRKDQNIANAAEEGKDIFSYKNSSGASIDYKNLVYEFLETEN